MQDETILLSINLTEKLDKYEDNLRRITNFNKGDREARLAQCKELETEIMEIRQRYICELRQLETGPDRKNFVEDLKRQMDRYSKLMKIYDERANAINPEDLENLEPLPVAPVVEENVTPEQAFARATKLGDELQDKTEAVIHGMQDDALDAEDIANATNQKLGDQLDQLNRINNAYDEVGEATGKARKQTDAIKKAFTRDKFTISLTVIDVLLFIAIMSCYIFWHPSDVVIVEVANFDASVERSVEKLFNAASGPTEMNYLTYLRGSGKKIKYEQHDPSIKQVIDEGDVFVDEQVGPRFPDEELFLRTGIDEGLRMWEDCLGPEPEFNQLWNVRNPLIPYAIRGRSFGIVDFVQFSVDENEQFVCDHPSYNFRETWSGWRNMSRSAFHIDWL